MENVLFCSVAQDAGDLRQARRMIASLRRFGGEIGQSPFDLFTTSPGIRDGFQPPDPQVTVRAFDVPDALARYPFAAVVGACAQAEAAANGVHTLARVDPTVLFVQPPERLALGEAYDAAVRPVHWRNIGPLAGEPLEAYWQAIYRAVGVEDVDLQVTSFLDQQPLRAYFNAHAVAVNPRLGIMQRWWAIYRPLVEDVDFQTRLCADPRRRIFLFQAVLSTLLAASLPPERVRILPPTYSYPYNLQDRIPPERCIRRLNDLVCFTAEGRSLDPDSITDAVVDEPLRGWLRDHGG